MIVLHVNFAKQQSFYKRIIESKEDDLRDCKDKHNNEIAELNEAMQNLQKNFDKVREMI